MSSRPFPPGSYPVVVVGSGPGALQTAYFLARAGIDHAVVSSDPDPGGMFRRFPFFQRLISWTKLHTAEAPDSRAYEVNDWNSLLAEEPENRGLVSKFMDGTSYFPSRGEVEKGHAAFAEQAGVTVRYDCPWTGTRRSDDGFVIETPDGEYRCKIAIFAIGMTEAWKPSNIPGIEDAPHYVDTRPPEYYAGKSVFIIGKRNSAFELADGLLPWARTLILVSPRPLQTALTSFSVATARARYLQPYEDHVLGGGNFVFDAGIEGIERAGDRWRISTKGTTKPGDLTVEVDEVIAATGFGAPLGDLPDLGVSTFSQGKLPAQTPFWESASVPGVFFAGSVSLGAQGLMKYGIASSSGAIHGFRHNARLLVRHIAERYFDKEFDLTPLAPNEVVSFLLAKAKSSSELWNQKSYLAHEVRLDPDRGPADAGVVPLAHFVDAPGPDAVAIAVETDRTGDIHPAVYIRRGGRVEEHLLGSHPLLDFASSEHRAALTALIQGIAA